MTAPRRRALRPVAVHPTRRVPARPSTSSGIQVYRPPWAFPCDACREPVVTEAVDCVLVRGSAAFEVRSGHPGCMARLRRELDSPESTPPALSCAGCGLPVPWDAVVLSRGANGPRRGHEGCVAGLGLLEKRRARRASARAAGVGRVRSAVVRALGDVDPRDELDAFAARLRDALNDPDFRPHRRNA